MSRRLRITLIICSIACVVPSVFMLMRPELATPLAWITLLSGSVLAGVASISPRTSSKSLVSSASRKASRSTTSKRPAQLEESDDIRAVTEERRRELMRGASKQLMDFRYRYSVRMHHTDAGEHRCFNADVNTVRLGFVPAIITDNTNDRQGYGYVAFVHDGHRWRGPGLPCPAGQMEAVRHASRCVSPLAKESETTFEGAPHGS